MMRPETGKMTKPPQHLKECPAAPWQWPSSPWFKMIQKVIWRAPRKKPITAETCWMKTNSRWPICKNILTSKGLFSTKMSMAICLMSMIRLMFVFRSSITGPNMTRLCSMTLVRNSAFTTSGSRAQRSGQCLLARLSMTAALVSVRGCSKEEKKSSSLIRSMISSTVMRVPIMMSHDLVAMMCARLGTMPCQPKYGSQHPTNCTG
mmetsp:Transcript_25962/g.74307  ORF Transcript_25962/g.74307 Transcript_25962/m.74307 type:complete len:205 (-) Transcript_25962:355-969(-)